MYLLHLCVYVCLGYSVTQTGRLLSQEQETIVAGNRIMDPTNEYILTY